MIKIELASGIGTVTWTLPATLQQRLAVVPQEALAPIHEWAGRMLEGYLLTLSNTLVNPANINWLDAETVKLVEHTLLAQVPPAVPVMTPSSPTRH